MESSRNSNNGSSPAGRYIMDDFGILRNVEPLEMIQETTEYSSSSRPPPTRGTRRSMAWPFYSHTRSGNSRSGHSRSGSEAASTTFSTFSNFRWANWQHRSFLRITPDDTTSSISQSIVPDYIVNYLRGETPESLAMKREQQRTQQGSRNAVVTPRLEGHESFPIEYGNYYSSSTDLTRGLNGHSSNSRQSGLRRHLTGWRGGVVFNSLISFLILVAEIVLLIVVLTQTRVLSGDSAVWSGDCGRAERMNIGVHIVVNIFGIVLLAGANYVFQVLSSPTRQEVDKAHESQRWLDIGVTSIRNFAHISGFRAILGTIVLVTAIAIQVIYNAVIYVTHGGRIDGLPEPGSSEQPTNSNNNDDANTTTTSCSLNINGPMFGIVMLLNLALLLGTATILARATFEPLATVGDALRSFLREPDRATLGACLLTKRDVKRGRWGLGEPRAFAPRTHLWLHTPSPARWLLTTLAWVAACGPAAAGLALLLTLLRGGSSADAAADSTSSPASSIFPIFGTPYANLLSPAQPAAPQSRSRVDEAAVRTALMAALPHLLLAVLYLVVNALLTTYFLGQEYALFAAAAPAPAPAPQARGAGVEVEGQGEGEGVGEDARPPPPRLQPRPLRVSSSPAGQQITSLYLTLPRPVSWVLLVAFAALGFLASQAVAPVVYMNNDAASSPSPSPTPSPSFPPNLQRQQPIVAITINTTALLALLSILALLALLVLSLGLRSAPPAPLSNASYDDEEKRGKKQRKKEKRGNPLAQALRGGSCSAVFSAACHAPRGEHGAARGCVAWGVVSEDVPQFRFHQNQDRDVNQRAATPLSPFFSPTTPSPFIAYNDGMGDGADAGVGAGAGAGAGAWTGVVGRCAFSGNVAGSRSRSNNNLRPHRSSSAIDPIAEEGMYAPHSSSPLPPSSAGLRFVDLERRYA